MLLVLAVFLLFTPLLRGDGGYKKVDTSVAITAITQGNYDKVRVDDKQQKLRVDLKKDVSVDGKRTNKITTSYPAEAADEIYTLLVTEDKASSGAKFDTKVSTPNLLLNVLVTFVPFILIAFVLFFFISQMQGGGSRVMNFGKSKAKLVSKDTPKTTFADVAGVDEAIEELEEIKEFLEAPAKFQAIGAKIPKGVLLYGPPGTGKTLLARAVAGEAGVPFYSISG
ncbi:MAG: cell division protein FtsH, partial [Pseudonocardiales bacterium]